MEPGPDQEKLLRNLLQHLLYLALSVLIFVFTARRLRQYLRLRRFPGPPTTGISYLWHSKAVLSGKAHLCYGEVTMKYGSLARIGPDMLVTSSPELWAHINAARSPYTRSEWYYHSARFEPGKDNVFTDCNNDRHDARRKKMASGYAGKENPTLEPSIDGRVKELIHLLRSKYAVPAACMGLSKPVNLARTIQYFTLDTISELALGKSFGDLRADEDINDYIKSSEDGLKIGNSSWGLGIVWIRDLPIIGKAISPSERDEKGFGKMMAHARKLVSERISKSTAERSDMISAFIRHGIGTEDLFQEIFEQLLAGSDTTATALRVALLYLITHPRVYAKLQAEIDDAVNSGLAPASPEVIPDAQARRLPYLAAVIRESTRMHPAAGNLFPRIVPKGGDKVMVDGKEVYIPEGTSVGVAVWGMQQYNKEVFGEDALIFRPERWFPTSDTPEEQERMAQMLRTNDMVFGYGRWKCLGSVVAQIELNKVLFELLRNFDLALVNPEKPWNSFNTLGLFEIHDMWVEVTQRP